MSPETDILADILIVGGGLAGGTMAAALAYGGLTAVVVDREDPAEALTAGYDGRASALALAPVRMLRAVGLWSAMAAEAEPILDIRIVDGDSPLFLHYDHADVGEEPFGWIVENRVTRRALAARLPELLGVTRLAPARLVELERDAAGVRARTADGRRIRARLLIGADGRDSETRRRARISVTRLDYGQTAIVCTVRHERPHLGVAVERFLPGGPFAILPMTEGRSNIVWGERNDLVPTLMALDGAGFMAELERRFGDFLGRLELTGPRFSYPLSFQLADRYTDRRLALIADAAHAMHPVAGQGLNMGLRDVAALAEVLVDAHRLGLDIGSVGVLARYQRWRRFDNLLMSGLTDGMVRLFSNDVAPLRLARDLGLAAVERLPALKKIFMRHAMGLVGDLPRLLRGETL